MGKNRWVYVGLCNAVSSYTGITNMHPPDHVWLVHVLPLIYDNSHLCPATFCNFLWSPICSTVYIHSETMYRTW